MKTKGEKRPRWIVVQSYNFRHKFEFERAKNIFNKLSKGEIKEIRTPAEMTPVNLVVDEMKKLNRRLKKLRKLKKKNKLNKEEMSKLREQINFSDNENKTLKKDNLKAQIPEFRNTIKSLIAKLDTEGEPFFQKHLGANDWIFGTSYEKVIPKRKADPENQPDFILKRHDGFCDVVEIEKPSKPLFTKQDKSGKSRPTSLLTQAISQTMDYIDSYNEGYLKLFYQDTQKSMTNPIHAYYPKRYCNYRKRQKHG